jgi:rubrerythrin
MGTIEKWACPLKGEKMITFAGREVLELALKIEENGASLYRLLTERTKDTNAAEVFGELAKEEQEHISRIKGWLSGLAEHTETESYPGEYVAYMKSLADESVYHCDNVCQGLVSKAATELEAIQVGMFFEKDFLLFLHEMKSFIKPAEKEVVNSLIVEEKRHLMQLVQLKSFLAAK